MLESSEPKRKKSKEDLTSINLSPLTSMQTQFINRHHQSKCSYTHTHAIPHSVIAENTCAAYKTVGDFSWHFATTQHTPLHARFEHTIVPCKISLQKVKFISNEKISNWGWIDFFCFLLDVVQYSAIIHRMVEISAPLCTFHLMAHIHYLTNTI